MARPATFEEQSVSTRRGYQQSRVRVSRRPSSEFCPGLGDLTSHIPSIRPPEARDAPEQTLDCVHEAEPALMLLLLLLSP
eukprot:SAG22_NODE_10566_length_527_cov_1.329439_1_plen_79_part_10